MDAEGGNSGPTLVVVRFQFKLQHYPYSFAVSQCEKMLSTIAPIFGIDDSLSTPHNLPHRINERKVTAIRMTSLNTGKNFRASMRVKQNHRAIYVLAKQHPAQSASQSRRT